MKFQELPPLPWFGWSKPNELTCASKIQVAWVRLHLIAKDLVWWLLVRVLRCSWKGHEIGDTGYLFGSNMRDVWCRHCQKFSQIPYDEAGLPQADGDKWKTGA